MILGIGIDLVEVSRMERAISRWGDRMVDRLFHPGEMESCRRRAQPAECLAAAFAAKEALLKALGTPLARRIGWRDVELLRAEGHAPTIRLTGMAQDLFREMGGTRTWVSISHQGGFSVAVVIIEG
jgi:holo-[acyl-carrier protein] synthase